MMNTLRFLTSTLLLLTLTLAGGRSLAQGVTTSAMNGLVTDATGEGLIGANVVAVHQPSGTVYGVAARSGGLFTIPNMRVGGPYSVTVTFIGYEGREETGLVLNLGQNFRLDFTLSEQAVGLDEVQVTAEQSDVLNSDRTGAATFVGSDQVAQLPSIKRSTRDLMRIDPRNDGNYSFAGRNWLYNNVSVDGSYFNNAFGLDDPSPGGQANAEPVPFDAVEQVQVSIAPFDIRQGGFTGANVNTVTKSGTNEFKGSVYSFFRNENLIGNTVSGTEVIANPDLSFNQSGFTIGGPIIKNKLFFFANGEIERRDDPGTNFAADQGGGRSPGESRVEASVMDQIRQRMMDVYDYDTGAYDDYIHETDNNKLLLKLDWNINENNNVTFRYNYLDAVRGQGPHPFVLSFANTGRGPNSTSLPFENAGYAINNELNSFALELNSRSSSWANRFFASYNRFRDFREPFSEDFPTIEIGEAGVTYTTVGHEPFSINNILDQDVLQVTNNFSFFKGKHVLTAGVNFEYYSFFNSFNIFRHGVFFLDNSLDFLGGATFSSLDDFFARTDPDSESFYDFRSVVASGPFKGENIEVAQFAVYAQDELVATPQLNITAGLRVDFPMYLTDPVANPFSTSLTLLDENDQPETVDQADLPGTTPLLSPRLGFNYDVTGDRTTQLRGGTGIFTGRIPFVWYGNVISNPGDNPNLYDPAGDGIALADVPADHETGDDSILQQSFDLNGMDPDFKFPQVWTTNFAIDQQLPGGFLGTLEVLYGKDINAVYVRNADLVRPTRLLNDGRPYFGGSGANELNSFFPGSGEGVYVIDNTSEGYNLNIAAQLRKSFDFGLDASVSYAFTEAKNRLRSSEIASVLWQSQPVQGDPNNPSLAFSEFGNRHRFVGVGNYRHQWNQNAATSFGVFVEVAEGNRFTAAGGNRYSFIYSGDVNGDGQAGNDLIYIPTQQTEVRLDPITDGDGNVISTPAEQWAALDAFIEQDDYLSQHRGEIAERFSSSNPWFSNIDVRILQDVGIMAGGKRHTLQISLDVQNVANLINSDWGVRRVASAAAANPLSLTRHNEEGEPVFNFTGPRETYEDDPGLFSRWRAQLGVRYIFN